MMKDKKVYTNKEDEIQKMQNEILKREKEREAIRKQFNFKIPLYILDGIIEHKVDKEYTNLYLYINMAVKVGTLREEDAKIIKEYVKTEN